MKIQCHVLAKKIHVALPLVEEQDKGLLELHGSGLEHHRDVLQIRDDRGPALLLKVLIVNQPLADPRLLSRQAATLLGKMSTGAKGLISGWHRQRGVDLGL